MSTATSVRGPKPFAVGGDFKLWLKRFEAYARSTNIPLGRMCDSLLALLDDGAFRAFDLLIRRLQETCKGTVQEVCLGGGTARVAL